MNELHEKSQLNMPVVVANHNVSNNYYVKRNMFFAVTDSIMEDSLTKEQADILCKKLNDEELDDTYVWYTVHDSTND